MTEKRSLRDRSRDWSTCGNQMLINAGLNGWGLELFVESYWDALEKTPTDDGEIYSKKIQLVYRGMEITLDPTVGIEAMKAEDKESDDG